MDLSLLRQKTLARMAALPIVDRHIYVAKHGPARGLRRQGGLGRLPSFLPRSDMWSTEEAWLDQLELTGQVVYDIGGDQGLLTLAFAREVGRAGRVVTLEPTPHSSACIRANIRHNSFDDRCTVIEAACGAAPGSVTLHLESGQVVTPDSASVAARGHIIARLPDV